MLQDERKLFTKNEKQILYDEVHGRCPMCGIPLMQEKNGRLYHSFEVAHIYPVNPTQKEKDLLAGEERLSDDVNDLKNVIAVCHVCHDRFDTPRTVDGYRLWVKRKKRILEENETKSKYRDYTIEENIKVIIEKLHSMDIKKEGVALSLESLKVDEKANDTLPYILRRTIKNNIIDYFYFIQKEFENMDKVNPYKFNLIASQIRSFYYKCMIIYNNQEKVYYSLIDWLDEKTEYCSKPACEVLIAFFIQDCEVFS